MTRSRHHRLQACLAIAGLSLLLATAPASSQVHDSYTVAQRPVGYTLGDLVPRTIVIEHDADWTLQLASLPAPGPQAYWLELRDVETSARTQGATTTSRITLTYQSFYAPIAVRELQLPALTLRVARGNDASTIEIPPWPFTMAPLREVKPVARDDGDDWMTPRPDRTPHPADTAPLRRQLLVAAALALAIALLLAWQHGWFPFRRRGDRPFTDAAKAIRRQAAGEDAYRNGFRLLHDAFNRSAGRVLMADDLDAFLGQRPALAGSREAIARWFLASRQLFFADDAQAARTLVDEKALRQLATTLSRSEQRA